MAKFIFSNDYRLSKELIFQIYIYYSLKYTSEFLKFFYLFLYRFISLIYVCVCVYVRNLECVQMNYRGKVENQRSACIKNIFYLLNPHFFQ